MNEPILRALNSLAGSPGADRLIIFLAETLPWLLIIGAAVYAVWHWQQVNAARQLAFVFLATISSWLLAQVIKYFYFSPRPFLVLSDLNQLIQHGANDSFPSGHATLFMALGTGLYLLNKKLGNLFIIAAVLISLARIAAGIHWPLDILAGWLLAWAVVLITRSLFSQALYTPDQFRQF